MKVHINLKSNSGIPKLENLGLKCLNSERLLKYRIFTCECTEEILKQLPTIDEILVVERDGTKGIQ